MTYLLLFNKFELPEVIRIQAAWRENGIATIKLGSNELTFDCTEHT
jgi:hypothetical protein